MCQNRLWKDLCLFDTCFIYAQIEAWAGRNKSLGFGSNKRACSSNSPGTQAAHKELWPELHLDNWRPWLHRPIWVLGYQPRHCHCNSRKTFGAHVVHIVLVQISWVSGPGRGRQPHGETAQRIRILNCWEMQQTKNNHTFVSNNSWNLAGLFRRWNEGVPAHMTVLWIPVEWPNQHALHGGPIWAKNKSSHIHLNEQGFAQWTGHNLCQYKIHCGLFGGNSQWAFSQERKLLVLKNGHGTKTI